MSLFIFHPEASYFRSEGAKSPDCSICNCMTETQPSQTHIRVLLPKGMLVAHKDGIIRNQERRHYGDE